MKATGIVVILLGVVIIYIGITGSQHRVMDILKGIHLSGSGSAGSQSTGTKSSPPATANPGPPVIKPLTGGGGTQLA
jgi:hypothetical protein